MNFTKLQVKQFINPIKTELKKSYRFTTVDRQMENYQLVVNYIQQIADKIIPENMRNCFRFQLQNKLYSGYYCLNKNKEIELNIKSLVYRSNKLYITFRKMRLITEEEKFKLYSPLLKEQKVIDRDSSSIILDMLVDMEDIKKEEVEKRNKLLRKITLLEKKIVIHTNLLNDLREIAEGLTTLDIKVKESEIALRYLQGDLTYNRIVLERL